MLKLIHLIYPFLKDIFRMIILLSNIGGAISLFLGLLFAIMMKIKIDYFVCKCNNAKSNTKVLRHVILLFTLCQNKRLISLKQSTI